MADAEFVSVLTDAIVASGGTVAGVAIDSSGEMQTFGAGQLDVELAEQTSSALLALASRLMFHACKGLGPATELRWPIPNHRRVDSSLRTFDITAAAAVLNLSAYTLRAMAMKGVIPAAKVGRKWVFTDEALAEYLRGEIKQQTDARCGNRPEEIAPIPTSNFRKGRRRPTTPPPLEGLLVKPR